MLDQRFSLRSTALNSAALLNCSCYNVETDLVVIGNQGWKEVAVKKDADLVVLCTVQGELQANVMKAHLESEGIPALLEYESAGIVFGLTVNGLGEVRILVPRELEEEAKRIIEPGKDDDTDID